MMTHKKRNEKPHPPSTFCTTLTIPTHNHVDFVDIVRASSCCDKFYKEKDNHHDTGLILNNNDGNNDNNVRNKGHLPQIPPPPQNQNQRNSDFNNFEDILEALGGFGPYQFFILILLLILEIPTAFVTFIPIFVGKVPQVWICGNETMSLSEVCSSCKSGAIPLPQDLEESIVAQWGLICEKEWVFDFVTSIQMLGMFFGSVFGSQFSDWYGRRYGFLAATLLLSVGSAISALAGNPYIYALSRFLCGAGVTSFMNVTLVGVVEVMPPKWRSLSNCVGPTGEGIMILSLLAHFIRPWRTLYWATVAPFALIVVIYPFVPESPRWLFKQSRLPEAASILELMSRMNGTNKSVTITTETLRLILEKEQELDKQQQFNKRWTYLDFIKDPLLRVTSLYNMAIWFAWSLTYYGISFNIKNIEGNIYLNVFLMGLSNALGQRSALLLNNRLGRRKALFASMTFCATFLVALAITLALVDHSSVPNLVIISLCLLGQFGMASARSACRLISGESFPTAVRTMGMGIGGITANLGGCLTTQLAYLGSFLGSPQLPFFVFALVSVGGSLISFRMAETMGRPLDGGDDKQADEKTSKKNSFSAIFTNNNLTRHQEINKVGSKETNINIALAKRNSNIKTNLKSENCKNVVLLSISSLGDAGGGGHQSGGIVNPAYIPLEERNNLNSSGRNTCTA